MKDRLVDAGYAAGWRVVREVPAPLAGGAFRTGADAALRRNGPMVRRLRANLQRVVGGDVPESLMRDAMRSYARYWLETFRLPAMNRTAVVTLTDLAVEGTVNLDAAYQAGRGVILALPHTGNWDVAAMWLIDRGMPFTTIVERLRPESLYRRFVAFREGLGMEILPLTGGPTNPFDILSERLRAGGVVCLVSDRDLTASGVPVTFFGETATMPAGPALLAIRTGAALLPAHLWFQPRGWAHRMYPPLDIPAEGSLRERIQVVTQRLADTFAEGIARHPADWHMVQRLWRADLADRMVVPQPPSPVRPDRPRRPGRLPTRGT